MAPKQVHEIWPDAAPLLRRATARTGLCAFADIERDVLSGNALLRIAWNGSAIKAIASTSLQLTDAGKVRHHRMLRREQGPLAAVDQGDRSLCRAGRLQMCPHLWTEGMGPRARRIRAHLCENAVGSVMLATGASRLDRLPEA